MGADEQVRLLDVQPDSCPRENPTHKEQALTDLPHLLRYVRANDVSRLDPTSLGHLQTWVAEGLSQLELDRLATAGVDAEMDSEIAGQTEELRKVEAKIREIRGW